MKIFLPIFILMLSLSVFGQTYSRVDENGKGEITITRVRRGNKDYLKFKAYAGGVQRGTCVGEKEGLAEFISPTVADFDKMEKEGGENHSCRLTFIFTKRGLTIKEVDCSDYHGAACYFGGNYKLGKLK